MSCSTVPALAPTAPMMFPLEMMGMPPLKDDDFAGIAFLNTEKWLSRLREPRQIRGSFVEHSRCYRLIDGEVDAPDERAILAQEGTMTACGTTSTPTTPCVSRSERCRSASGIRSS